MKYVTNKVTYTLSLFIICVFFELKKYFVDAFCGDMIPYNDQKRIKNKIRLLSKRVPLQKGPLVDPNSFKSNQRKICFPLEILAWQGDGNPSQNFWPGEGRFRLFLRNWVTYREHLPLDIVGGWHLPTSQILRYQTLYKCGLNMWAYFQHSSI